MLTLSEIQKIVQPISLNIKDEIEIDNIQYDSRKCNSKSLFVAIVGFYADGHKYLNEAQKNGCQVFLGEKELDIKNYIRVEDSRLALGKLAFHIYNSPQKDLNVIGITGTNGKTTTAHLVKAILDESGEKTALIGTNGVLIGNEELPATHTTPESLELAAIFSKIKKAGCKNVVMEVSSHALHQKRVQMIDFNGAIFTNITQDHLDYHETMDEYKKAKKILFDSLKKDAVAIYNGNDLSSKFMAKDCKADNYFLLTNTPDDIYPKNFLLQDIEFSLEGISFTIRKEKDKLKIKSPLTGKFNVYNASLAASLLLKMQYPEEVVKKGLEKAQGASGRMQKINLPNGALAVVDYAHTPDGLEKALEALKQVIESVGKGSLITVFGCGGDRDKSKRPQMGYIATKLSNYAIITSDNPRTEDPSDIINDIKEGISNNNYEVIEDRRLAIRKALAISGKNDIVLIAGKGHENYQIIGITKHHFDDVEEVQNLVQEEL